MAFVFRARDLAVRLDRSMEIECCAGLEIITAAVAHLAIRYDYVNMFQDIAKKTN